VNIKRRKQKKQHAPERKKHSKAAHDQESWKAQQKREVVERRSEEPSKC